MERTKKKTHKQKRFKFLLDEAFASSSAFPRLSKKSSVKHIVYDFGFSRQIDDLDIYREAIKTNRFVVTINYKDFKNFIQKGKQGIIAIPSGLSNKEIDDVLCEFVAHHKPDECMGKLKKLTEKDLIASRKRKQQSI